MNTTTHLLISNDKDTIENTLKSITKLNSQILIGDLGSNDGSIQICRKLGAIIIPLLLVNDRSVAKNQLLSHSKTRWNFYLEPSEILLTGHDAIVHATESNDLASYNVQLMRGNIITKEIRLTNKKLKFSNPIYESLEDPSSIDLEGVVIYAKHKPIAYSDMSKRIEEWKRNQPTAHEPHYYHAFLLLEQKQYTDFIKMAEHYLFHKKQGMPAVMIRYYLAIVYLYEFNDAPNAIKYTLECLATRPLMAEFWCLLGDIYYKAAEYQKAIAFYENAKFLGGKRLKADNWPLDVTKYQQHPERFIASCKNMLNQSKPIVYTKE